MFDLNEYKAAKAKGLAVIMKTPDPFPYTLRRANFNQRTGERLRDSDDNIDLAEVQGRIAQLQLELSQANEILAECLGAKTIDELQAKGPILP